MSNHRQIWIDVKRRSIVLFTVALLTFALPCQAQGTEPDCEDGGENMEVKAAEVAGSMPAKTDEKKAEPRLEFPLPRYRPLGSAGKSTIRRIDPVTEEFVPMPDRWRLGFPHYDRYQPPQGMPFVQGHPWDPYNQNVLKGDYPIRGNDLFFVLNAQDASNFNPRQIAANAAEKQLFYNKNIVLGVELFKGDTVFQPKEWSAKVTAIFNVNALAKNDFDIGALNAGKRKVFFEEAFVEKRLAVLGPEFDFVSARVGMQNLTSDFRGYVFSENQLGVRVFGNARSNRDQYNLIWFPMRQRDEASQFHTFHARNQNVFIANYFRQDFLKRGYTALWNVHHNDDDGFGADRGRLRATYLGCHGDGHWGAWNVSHAFYQVWGRDDANRLAGQRVNVKARMAAAEVSKDADWKRYRFSVFYASGDDDLNDGKAEGFDVISDNPNLAGGAFMFWTQQQSNLPMGLGVLSNKFSLLPSLRNKFTQQANFVNPGLFLINAGMDCRVNPKLKLVTNLSYLRFAESRTLQQLTGDGGIGKGIGWDVSVGAKYRPQLNENVALVGGVSVLFPQGGFERLAGSDKTLFSGFAAMQFIF